MEYDKFKRILDVTLSSILLIIMSPILLTIGIAVKLDSEGPIIYKQKRVGKSGKEFTIYKFRTMSKDNNAYDFTKKDEVTKIGRFLRQIGIDELPQLFNILKGDMSIIGPRPISFKFYESMTTEQKKRIDVKPGLLGPIKCTMDETSMVDRIEEDLNYVENHSFINDIKIILEFIVKYEKIVLSRKNSSYGNKENVVKQVDLLKGHKRQQEITQYSEKYDNEDYISELSTYNFNSINQQKNLKKVLVLARKNND